MRSARPALTDTPTDPAAAAEWLVRRWVPAWLDLCTDVAPVAYTGGPLTMGDHCGHPDLAPFAAELRACMPTDTAQVMRIVEAADDVAITALLRLPSRLRTRENTPDIPLVAVWQLYGTAALPWPTSVRMSEAASHAADLGIALGYTTCPQIAVMATLLIEEIEKEGIFQ